MANDTKIFIYYGPLSWFDRCVGKKKKEGLLEDVFEREESSREFRIVQSDRDSDEDQNKPRQKRPKRLVAESGDYASLREHAITNFSGLIQAHNPKELHLHNPPEHVHEHLKRTFTDTFEVVFYEYPSVTRDTLVQYQTDFAQNLIGQKNVKESLLAALYPLTRRARAKPVVIMFYGPSGVGKTQTAEFVNGLLGGALMRKQFSMYQNEKFASYLFGGAHSEASFAHDLLDRESGVVLLDEFDKAASVFHSAFYQFFDGGVFQDKNYRVDVGRSLIICTSNYGSEKAIQDALGDALYSRFDALIKFEPLSQNEIKEVIDRLVDVRFKALEADERQILDATQVKETLYPLARHAANVRKLGKTTDELISTLLVRSLIHHDSTLIENADATDHSQ